MKNKSVNGGFRVILLSLLTLISLPAAAGLQLTTYNTGLAEGYLPHVEERKIRLLEALQAHDTDVLCLQEVWNNRDREEIVRRLKSHYPYAFWSKKPPLKSSHAPVCRWHQLVGKGRIVNCLYNHCSDKSGQELSSCFVHQCGPAMRELAEENGHCAQALMAKVGRNPFKSFVDLVNPLSRQNLHVYNGSDGLLMLSKKPLLDKAVIDLSRISTLINRNGLYVEVATDDGAAGVVCAHLTVDYGETLPYVGSFASWKEENAAQILALLEFVRQKSQEKNQETYLAGDFNCGFADSFHRLSGEIEDNCRQMSTAGLVSYLAVSEKPECTYCSDNLLVQETPSLAANDSLIDHVFGPARTPLKVQRVFTERMTLKNGREMNISDHFGIQVQF